MIDPNNLWRVVILTTDKTVNAFEEALYPHSDAVSWQPTDRDGEWQVEGFSVCKPNREKLTEALSVVADVFSIPVPEVLITPVESSNWIADNLRMFPPVHAGRFFIYGSNYQNSLPFGLISIRLDPGRAFGAGNHASTMGCLHAISDMIGKKKYHKPLDMGTGSGILSIALAKVWRVPVYGFDADVNAVSVAKENFRRNNVLPQARVKYANACDSSAVVENAPYDLVVSNILANSLCQMAKKMSRISRDISFGGSVAILSGFLDCDANRVYSAYKAYGFCVVRTYHIKGWCTLVLER